MIIDNDVQLYIYPIVSIILIISILLIDICQKLEQLKESKVNNIMLIYVLILQFGIINNIIENEYNYDSESGLVREDNDTFLTMYFWIIILISSILVVSIRVKEYYIVNNYDIV